MLNFVCGLMIVTATTLVGVSYSNKFKDKLIFYQSIVMFNDKLIENIGFYKQDIMQLLECNYQSQAFNSLLSGYNEHLKSQSQLSISSSFLTVNEKNEILRYFDGIGKNDIEGEMAFLTSQGKKFLCQLSEQKLNVKKYSSMSVKLSFALGMIVMIIII